MPTLLVRGGDEQHPQEVSDLYAGALPEVTELPASTVDVAAAIAELCAGIEAAEGRGASR